MKTIISTLLILFFVTTASVAQVRLAPFLAYGEGLNCWGLGAYAEMVIDDRLSFSPYFTQYFPESLNDNPRLSGWELNGNVNYYVVSGDVASLYGLAGLNYTNIRTRTSTPSENVVDNDGNFGFNFGIGTMVNIKDYLFPFVEGKYTAGGYSQAGLIIGVKFQLGKRQIDYDY